MEVGASRVLPTWVDKQAGWVIRHVDASTATEDRHLADSRARTASVLGEFMVPIVTGLQPPG